MTGTAHWELSGEWSGQPAGRVVPLLLDQFLQSFLEHEPGVLAGDDEDLHQYRVAVRRARSLLEVSASVVPADRRRTARRRLRALGALTSPVRDADVLLATWGELCGGLDWSGQGASVVELAGGLGELAEAVGTLRDRHRADLVEGIRGEVRPEAVRAWRDVATVHLIGGDPPGPRARTPVSQWAAERTRAAHRRCRRLARAAERSDDLEHWHDLRKGLKRLRYLLEAFGPLMDPEDLRPVLRHLRRLQDTIGGLQDTRVQSVLIADAAVLCGPRGRAAADAVSAVLDRRLEEVHGSCRAAWSRFDTRATRDRVAHLTATT